ncbi:MAG TPA: hypothetical protein VGM43_10215 [Bryobacteraceae bacterium]|jgi:uncharacterized protein (TIGR03437 family)
MLQLRRRAPFIASLGAVLGAAVLIPAAAKATTPVFGSVLAIGGTPSDIALDETRGQLYVADMGGSLIDVVSTADNTIHSSINVLPFPGAIALSGDGHYLLVAHYCNIKAPASPACSNAVTSIDLTSGAKQVFLLASAPLGIGFVKDGPALVVTTTSFLTLDPATGTTQFIQTVASVAQQIPVPLATFPGQIIQASLTTSSDGNSVWGIASAGTKDQLIFRYNAGNGTFDAEGYVTSPTLLPRISTAADGSYAMVGYALIGPKAALKGRYPDAIESSNITGNVIDSVNGIIYAQIPDGNQPSGAGPLPAGSTAQSAMVIMDADNLTFRDRVSIPENMVGRAVLNSAATMMYVVSESGVMVLPVGSLNNAHRIAATVEDLLITTNFCNSSVLAQDLMITDPGGGATDFTVTTSQPGVTILPASGMTPATVKVLVDPSVVKSTGGTTVVTLNLTSLTAVNHPKPVRLLISNPDPSQRGAVISQPGVLSDILADTSRNRIYVLRQDMNQLLVYDGLTMNLLATLRTATSPTMMAMTRDQSYLLVGHDDSQYIKVYDLNTLTPVAPVLLPGGHFARSIAVSNAAILALARNEGDSPQDSAIDSIDLAAASAVALPSLGVWENKIPTTASVLTASPNGSSILMVSPDGNVTLYSAASNSFVISRHDLTSLSGAFAASDYGQYVAGNSVLNASLVPTGAVSPAGLSSSGFSFVNRGGYMAAAASASTAGTMLQVSSLQSGAAAPTSVLTTEAPLLPVDISSANLVANAPYGTYGSGGNNTHAATSFSRSLAVLPNAGTVVSLSTSGLTLLATSYPAAPVPQINAVTSAADGSATVAAGELVSIYGQNMSGASFAASQAPLTTGLGNACIGVNGSPIPLLYVSPGQINAQLPFDATGNATLTIHTPAGASNNFPLTVEAAAPSIFVANSGSETLGLVVRDTNGQLVTPTNPIHPKDAITIYLTGMGQTFPAIPAGAAAPSDPLSRVSQAPTLTIAGMDLAVSYAGLAPGQIGVYQINATVPQAVLTGMSMPLTINQGGAATTLNVRVVR